MAPEERTRTHRGTTFTEGGRSERRNMREEMTSDSQWRACETHPFQDPTSGYRGAFFLRTGSRAARRPARTCRGARLPGATRDVLSRREPRLFRAADVRRRRCRRRVFALAHAGTPLRWPRANNSRGVASERYVSTRDAASAYRVSKRVHAAAREKQTEISDGTRRASRRFFFFSLHISVSFSRSGWRL